MAGKYQNHLLTMHGSKVIKNRDVVSASPGIKSFIRSVIVISALMLAVAFAVIHLKNNFELGEEAYIALIALVFATAVGFAGAWAVVIVAEHANDLQANAAQNSDPDFALSRACLADIEQLRASLASLLALIRLRNQLSFPGFRPPVSTSVIHWLSAIEKVICSPAFTVVLVEVARSISETQEALFNQCRSALLESVGLVRKAVEDLSENDENKGQSAPISLEDSYSIMFDRAAALGAQINEMSINAVTLINSTANDGVKTQSLSRRVIYFAEQACNIPKLGVSSDYAGVLKKHQSKETGLSSENIEEIIGQVDSYLDDSSELHEKERTSLRSKVIRFATTSSMPGDCEICEKTRDTVLGRDGAISIDVHSGISLQRLADNLKKREKSKAPLLVTITEAPQQTGLISLVIAQPNSVVLLENVGAWITSEIDCEIRECFDISQREQPDKAFTICTFYESWYGYDQYFKSSYLAGSIASVSETQALTTGLSTLAADHGFGHNSKRSIFNSH